jgi:A/G-specific adenine glycosylase
MRRRIRHWYKRRARSLPWRETGDPYRIWISEIMLQQTTVTTVIPYYEKFANRFPDVQSLAEADEAEVLRYWEGLGYYSRARNIHKAARQIVESSNGEFPATIAGLTALPGIGRYTAGAIMSFAFDLPAPIVEANTLRLYSRLLAYAEDPRKSRGQKVLWSFAEHLLPTKNAGDFNQSLMDLGSLVCTPKDPNCEECPLNGDCGAFRAGLQHEIPMLEKRPTITEIVEVCVAVSCDGRFLLRQNPAGQWWAGLWDFVRFPITDSQATLPDAPFENGSTLPLDFAARLEQHLCHITGLADVTIERFVTEIRHSVTRYKIRLQCFVATTNTEVVTKDQESVVTRWVSPAEFDDFPLSMTGRKLANLVQQDVRQLRLL